MRTRTKGIQIFASTGVPWVRREAVNVLLQIAMRRITFEYAFSRIPVSDRRVQESAYAAGSRR